MHSSSASGIARSIKNKEDDKTRSTKNLREMIVRQILKNKGDARASSLWGNKRFTVDSRRLILELSKRQGSSIFYGNSMASGEGSRSDGRKGSPFKLRQDNGASSHHCCSV